MNKVDIAKYLIKYGADVDRPLDTMESGQTPLQHACKYELVDMVKMLLCSGAKDTDNIARKNSILENRDHIVQLLLNYGEICLCNAVFNHSGVVTVKS